MLPHSHASLPWWPLWVQPEKPEVTVSQYSCPPPGSFLNPSLGAPRCLQPPPTQHPITMHSLDEPLDLKLSISKLRAAREKRERTLSVVRHRALHRELGLVDDSPTPGSPGSPPSGTEPLAGQGSLQPRWSHGNGKNIQGVSPRM